MKIIDINQSVIGQGAWKDAVIVSKKKDNFIFRMQISIIHYISHWSGAE